MFSLKDRIVQILIQDKLITQDNLEHALKVQKEKGGQLSGILAELKFVDENKLLAAMSKVFSKPSIDITRFQIAPEVLKIIPPNICRQYQVIPVSKFGSALTLAMADPMNILALDDVKSLTGYQINPIIADSRKITQAINQCYGEVSSKSVIEELIQGISAENIELIEDKEEEAISSAELGRLAQEAPIVTFVNKIFEQAVNFKSSDIMLEPQENKLRIRFRIDGMLKEQPECPKEISALIVSRVKVISGLNIAEHRLPQDGRFKMKIGSGEVDFRVSVLPTVLGEKVVLRILDKSQLNLDIERLGFQEKALSELKECALKPYGMVLATGPTGSGKTTTLYSLIKLIDRPKINIVTVEDPVEFQIPGINQVNVQPEIGLSFASALRSILRQDPNVIMIGEIRDSQTVDIAIKSALTGHLVLSTLHTTTACGAVVRLMNMGIEPFLINSAINCIAAQRLARVLCPNCKEKYELKEDVALKLKLTARDKKEPYIFFRPKGCGKCFHTGYRGRVVLAEVLVLSPKIKELIFSRSQEHALKQAARAEGMQTLREDGLFKVRSGVISLEEMLRVSAGDE